MPTYDFKCATCDHRLSEIRSLQETKPHPDCPNCSSPMNKVYSAPLITFKGQGFNTQSA